MASGSGHNIPDVVLSDIRSTLLSRNMGVRLIDFNNDYQRLVGRPLEFRKYNFNSLTHLLESIPDVVM